MSYYTDLDNDRSADYECAIEQMETDIRECQWTTREGTTVLIKDMKTSHIRNTIRHITRNWKAYEEESNRYAELREIQREQLEEELENRRPNEKSKSKKIDISHLLWHK